MPGCETERLLAELSARELVWRQPYTGKEKRLRFDPAEVFCLALWSKDFGPLLRHPRGFEIIDPLRPAFLFTINDCPELERGLTTPLGERLAQAAQIAARYGPGRLLWRFDPIVHWREPSGQLRHNAASFGVVVVRMAVLGVFRCVLSFG